MACRLFGAKPLSKPMQGYCELDPKEHISMNFFKLKLQTFSFTKLHLKISSAKWWPFCPGADELKEKNGPDVLGLIYHRLLHWRKKSLSDQYVVLRNFSWHDFPNNLPICDGKMFKISLLTVFFFGRLTQCVNWQEHKAERCDDNRVTR